MQKQTPAACSSSTKLARCSQHTLLHIQILRVKLSVVQIGGTRQGHGLPSPIGQRLPFLGPFASVGVLTYTTNGRHRVTLKYFNYATVALGTDGTWLVGTGDEAKLMF